MIIIMIIIKIIIMIITLQKPLDGKATALHPTATLIVEILFFAAPPT